MDHEDEVRLRYRMRDLRERFEHAATLEERTRVHWELNQVTLELAACARDHASQVRGTINPQLPRVGGR
jgi:hypothetical protein